ncbi:hypothetical protein [Flavobacterium gilvum]|uniref:T9SS C-terminal target domain-containing protein n=1 Tax=Flavobacterium gilvum TaxID=1492737 RepID=A0AAC9I5V7_9FLAO|nr:hypothetical protein [Flavobacterium gilvum]AOW10999.1 hypothetical protein EM308_16745 [Flavobacterium gilvum]KFC58144.1 hypothetical protein FEM08_30990 [Flavobacterium gilvum]
MKKIFILFFLFVAMSYAQTKGCTDRLAENFNPKATENDGSCRYVSARIKVTFTKELSDSIAETSGLVTSDNLLWTHNDDINTTLYGIDTKGKIRKKINLEGVKNNEWEEISQDDNYLYIGDLGNNVFGNRKDLHFLRIKKNSMDMKNPVIDTIAFSYENQTDFVPKKEVNTTDFDCEAFVVTNDSIYLFTKQWVSEKTNVYRLPKTPGTYIAQFKETLNVDGLITGATLLPQKKGIVLCGYSHYMQPFVYLLYDYKNNDFLTGNKRKIKISLIFHQIEAITTEDGQLFYLTNEATNKRFIHNPQEIHTIDLSPYLKN